MSAEEISIQLDLHQGNCEGQAWDVIYRMTTLKSTHYTPLRRNI